MARTSEVSTGRESRTVLDPPPVADLRARVAKLFSYVEDLMYVGLAALLALSALVLLGASAVSLWDSIAQGAGPRGILGLLQQLLLVLMIVELLYTVQVSFREHVLRAAPFLLVALIAAVRRIILLTVEAHELASGRTEAFQQAMIELGVLTALCLSLVICLYLLRPPSQAQGAPQAERM